MSFWIDNPIILYTKRTEIIPLPGRSIPENINATMRFSILLGIILSVYKQNLGYLLIAPLAAIASIVILYALDDVLTEQPESFNTTKCQHPTPENPLMNVLYNDPVDRLPACDSNDPVIKAEVDTALATAFNLPVNVDNIYNQ
jgi:hypothetical protein